MEAEKNRLLVDIEAIFDSDVFSPDVSLFSKKHFELPCHRGETDYQIHLLESEGFFNDLLPYQNRSNLVPLCAHQI
ncbi:MAG: hypothetical protein ACI9BF_000320 [Candidatus Paceibacteria bacterium]|jgi:hypothetical protein